jgi:hypothetical protein
MSLTVRRFAVSLDHSERLLALGLLLLSTAGLTFEINLIRLFSVSQFYHFAFMIVSIALLGYGASGTILASYPGLAGSSLDAA